MRTVVNLVVVGTLGVIKKSTEKHLREIPAITACRKSKKQHKFCERFFQSSTSNKRSSSASEPWFGSGPRRQNVDKLKCKYNNNNKNDNK